VLTTPVASARQRLRLWPDKLQARPSLTNGPDQDPICANQGEFADRAQLSTWLRKLLLIVSRPTEGKTMSKEKADDPEWSLFFF
jgi:hypothetical protein